jgi:hypothetical protein
VKIVRLKIEENTDQRIAPVLFFLPAQLREHHARHPSFDYPLLQEFIGCVFERIPLPAGFT